MPTYQLKQKTYYTHNKASTLPTYVRNKIIQATGPISKISKDFDVCPKIVYYVRYYDKNKKAITQRNIAWAKKNNTTQSNTPVKSISDYKNMNIKFPLRSDLDINFELPSNITSSEISRLAEFIELIPSKD